MLAWGHFSDRRSWDDTRLPPGHSDLRTVDGLRPGLVRNMWPARHPGQPRTGIFQKIPTSKTYGQPPTGLFQNKRLRPLGMYLSAEVQGPQTAPLPDLWRYLCSRRRPRSTSKKLLPRSAGVLFSAPESSLVAPIVYSKGLHNHEAPSMGLFTKYRILEVHQNLLAPQKEPSAGVPL